MTLRCWIIVGSGLTELPQERCLGYYPAAAPEAAAFEPGDWIHWNPAADVQVVLVCVDLPLTS